jgi:hypothetical protein
MNISETLNEIKFICRQLIDKGLSVEERWPIKEDNIITWEGQKENSKALKNISYCDKYGILNESRNYNFKMLDGALIQMQYRFDSHWRKVVEHRLAYFPSPLLVSYDDAEEEYELEFYGESEFHDLIERNVVAFPIRFDFSSDENVHKEIDHPYSHATFGEFNYCRIPVCSPLTPSIFINFIVRNFYNRAYTNHRPFCEVSSFRHSEYITSLERKILHFRID